MPDAPGSESILEALNAATRAKSLSKSQAQHKDEQLISRIKDIFDLSKTRKDARKDTVEKEDSTRRRSERERSERDKKSSFSDKRSSSSRSDRTSSRRRSSESKRSPSRTVAPSSTSPATVTTTASSFEPAVWVFFIFYLYVFEKVKFKWGL